MTNDAGPGKENMSSFLLPTAAQGKWRKRLRGIQKKTRGENANQNWGQNASTDMDYFG
jgi:hypothetical protein